MPSLSPDARASSLQPPRIPFPIGTPDDVRTQSGPLA
jgi:hypothetical protein